METKACTKCKQVKELVKFIKTGKGGNCSKGVEGISPHCQECRDKNNEQNARWRKNNTGSIRLTQKAWRKRNKTKGMERKRLNKARWNSKNKHKRVAQNVVRTAVRNGSLERGPCDVCGTTENINGHHEDYSKPLDIVWLCREHHYKLHTERLAK